jgi:aspergillopepsin I
VTIGGTTVEGQAVELAKTVSSTFVSDGADGLVGLAFSSINTGKFI